MQHADEYGLALDLRNKTDGDWTALHLAAHYGHTEIVRTLLTSLAPLYIDAVTNDKATALMLAAEAGHDAVVEILLEFSASIHGTNKNGKSAIFLARQQKHTGIARLLTEHSSKQTRKSMNSKQNRRMRISMLQHELHDAAEKGDEPKVRRLLAMVEQPTRWVS